MNFRRLRYFTRIVDVGSLSQAAEILHVAQPGLSQQLMLLENEVNQKLVIRTSSGVIPTQAGKILYQHARSILRQCSMAYDALQNVSEQLTGQVCVGLAPGTAAQSLAVPLVEEVYKQYPGIILNLNESYGTILTDLLLTGQMDMAVLYDDQDISGLRFISLMREQLYFLCPISLGRAQKSISLREMARYELFLPRAYSTVRKTVDKAFASENIRYKVKGEIESHVTLNSVLSAGLGCSILPASAAKALSQQTAVWIAKIKSPVAQNSLSFCTCEHLPLSQPAEAVKSILLSLIAHDRQKSEVKKAVLVS